MSEFDLQPHLERVSQKSKPSGDGSCSDQAQWMERGGRGEHLRQPRVIRLRASSAPLTELCPASLHPAPGEVAIDSHDPTAQVGTSIHRAISMRLQGHAYPAFEGEDAADNEEMVDRAQRFVEEEPSLRAAGALFYEKAMGRAFLRRELNLRLDITGTVDVGMVNLSQGRGVATDWKTTYLDGYHEAQLLIYALLLLLEFDLEEVTIHTVFLRLNICETKTLSKAYVMAWWEEFIRNTLQQADTYRPGAQCGKCRRFAECPAVTAMNRKTVAELLDVNDDNELLNRTVAADLWDRVRVLQSTIEYFREFVKEEVLTSGPIALPNGRKIDQQVSVKKVVQWHQARSLLEKEFTPGELAKMIGVSKTKLDQMVGEKAPRGGKKKAQDAFIARLEQAGAIVREPSIMVKEMSDKEKPE